MNKSSKFSLPEPAELPGDFPPGYAALDLHMYLGIDPHCPPEERERTINALREQGRRQLEEGLSLLRARAAAIRWYPPDTSIQ